MDALIVKNYDDTLANINSEVKTSGSYSGTFQTVGAQIDANRIMCGVTLPFLAQNSNYTISDITCTILTVGTATATVDNKTTTGIRFSIAHSGTVGQSFAITIAFTITLV